MGFGISSAVYPLPARLALGMGLLCGCGQRVQGPSTRGWNDTVVAELGDALVVDARAPELYAAGHVPGALNLSWTELVAEDEQGLWDARPPKELAILLGERGITTDRPVVVYGSGPDGHGDDGIVYWALRWLGHPDPRVYDGGWSAWLAEGGEPSTEVAPRSGAFELALEPPVYADTAEVAAWDGVVLDVRSREEWDAGHIPGAVWLEWTTVFDHDQTLRSPDELQGLLQDLGIDPETPVVTYCRRGLRAGHSFMVLDALGSRDVATYVGSWTRWTAEGGEIAD